MKVRGYKPREHDLDPDSSFYYLLKPVKSYYKGYTQRMRLQQSPETPQIERI